MSVLDAIILGFLQGLTEFIPVSSSGHLIIGAKALGLNGNTFSFDVAIHIGTLLALLVYFRTDLINILRRWQTGERRLIINLIIGTIPAVIIGFMVQDFVEASTRSVSLVALTLGLVGLLMIWVDRTVKTRQRGELSSRSALLVGVAQTVALIPGVSRSGATILSGRLLGHDYKTVTRFSFLLAIPVTFGAALKVSFGESGLELWQHSTAVALAGTVTAALGGFLAIRFMLQTIQRIGLKWFGVYRLSLALLLSLLLITGVL